MKKVIENLNTARQTETTYSYDSVGRLLSTTDAEDGTASYEYDALGNITAMIDPNGGRTEYTYDSMGRILESLNAIGSRNSYTYNAQGLLESSVNARGQETTYTYYKNGWIQSFTDELGTVSYTYDANGNVLTVTDENGVITREYNELNQVTKYTDFRGNTVSYGYDQLGNLVTITYPGGRIVRYSYYKNGSVKTVTDWEDRVTSYEYDGNGRLTKTTRPDGSVETRSYDAAGRLVKQVDTNGDEVINARDYAYDEAGNIISATMSNGTEFSSLTNAAMEYDAANRLVKYNGVDVEYDADGNMTYGPLNGTMTELVYDCRNRLISAGGISYAYDAENNRISKTNGDTTTAYVIDTSGALSRILTAETDGKTTYFVYGIGLISQEDDSTVLYYHFSNIGSTEALTNLDGEIVDTFEYGPYGELTSDNIYGIIFLYNGEYGVAADENGLYYMRARYYNPEIKRFINQDVVIGSISDSPSMNRYAYVQGNPISYVDPFGLSPQLGWNFWGHMALGVLGMLSFIPTPVTFAIGAAANIINAAWYASEGNYFAAICSGLMVVGGAGSLLGVPASAAAFGNNAASLGLILKSSANVGFLAMGLGDIGAMVGHNFKDYVFGDKTYTPKQAVQDLIRGSCDLLMAYGGAKQLGLDKVDVAELADKFLHTKLKGSINLDSFGLGAKSTPGKFVGSTDNLTSDEKRVVNDLLNQGRNVEVVPRSDVSGVKTPDFIVDEVLTELKTLHGTSLNTPVTRIQEAFNQGAANVIIDARLTSLDAEQASIVLSRINGIYGNNVPGSIEIWFNQGVIYGGR